MDASKFSHDDYVQTKRHYVSKSRRCSIWRHRRFRVHFFDKYVARTMFGVFWLSHRRFVSCDAIVTRCLSVLVIEVHMPADALGQRSSRVFHRCGLSRSDRRARLQKNQSKRRFSSCEPYCHAAGANKDWRAIWVSAHGRAEAF